jgi:hypothetical protein
VTPARTGWTTVADIEIVLAEQGPYRGAVTFAGRDEIASHLRDNVWETAKALFEGRPVDVVQDRLLDHAGRGFTFSHILGRAALPEAADAAKGEADPGTTELVHSAVRAIRHVVDGELPAVMDAVAAGGDGRPAEEAVQGELETRVRGSMVSERIVEALLCAIEDRCGLLDEGVLRRGADGWPVSWSWESHDRAEFLRVVTRFSSEEAALFGTLLTPLVNGIRASGPFRPREEHDERRILAGGKGLGRTPGPTAKMPAPLAVMRTAKAPGNGDKPSCSSASVWSRAARWHRRTARGRPASTG